MQPHESELLAARARTATLALRRREHAAGHPFMLGGDGLPTGQVYLEYPDGRIAVAHYPGGGQPHRVLRWLEPAERETIRHRFNLPLP